MDFVNSVLTRFRTMPVPFSEQSLSSSFDLSWDSATSVSPDPFPRILLQKLTEDVVLTDSKNTEEIVMEKIQSTKISTADKSFLQEDVSSCDSGFGDFDQFDIPTSFEGLFNNPLTTSPEERRETDSNDCSPSTPTVRRVMKRRSPRQTLHAKHVSTKRPSPSQDIEASPLKRHKSQLEVSSRSEHQPSSAAFITSVLDLDVQGMTGDFTRPCCLPTILGGKHKDLKSISPQTMSDVLENKYNSVGEVTVIDCRYPYEFQGGHIQNAINICDRDTMYKQFFTDRSHHACDKRRVIIFHCEFSSERGPKMMRFLREMDREANKENYPSLYYPEIYLLEGGYKAFYQTHKNQCQPESYLPMDDKNHIADLKYMRVKSKSWSGEKSSKQRRVGRRLLKL